MKGSNHKIKLKTDRSSNVFVLFGRLKPLIKHDKQVFEPTSGTSIPIDLLHVYVCVLLI